MAVLTFTYDTGAVTTAEILTAFEKAYGWTATISDPANPGATLANPESRQQFARRMVRQYIVDILRSQRVQTATKAAAAAVTDPVFVD